jgi:hypothetical protein
MEFSNRVNLGSAMRNLSARICKDRNLPEIEIESAVLTHYAITRRDSPASNSTLAPFKGAAVSHPADADSRAAASFVDRGKALGKTITEGATDS